MRYMQEKRVLVPVVVDEKDLVTFKEASELLGISIQGVALAVDGGQFETLIIDNDAPKRQGRRLLLRVEVRRRKYGRRRS